MIEWLTKNPTNLALQDRIRAAIADPVGHAEIDAYEEHQLAQEVVRQAKLALEAAERRLRVAAKAARAAALYKLEIGND